MAHQFQDSEPTQGRSETQIQALRGELDAANKKVDRYVHLVASLSEELDNLRRSICHNCKQKFVPSYAPVSSSSVGPRPRPPLWRRIISGRQSQTPTSALPPVLPKNAGVSPNTSSTIRSITFQKNQINSTISVPPDASTSPSDQPLTFVAEESSWRVSHNPEVKQAVDLDLVKIFNFTAKVFCVKFSPDGKYLAVGLDGRSGKTHVYDVEKELEICTLLDLYLRYQPTLWGIQFSPDNKSIATTSDQGIRLWGIAQKRTRAVFPCNDLDSNCLSFSPNGRFLVASGGDNVSIWSLRDGSSTTLLRDVLTRTYSITFSPDGRHIASVDFNGWLRIWDARAGQLLDEWKGHPLDGYCVAFSPDGKGLVSGGDDGILKYWDVSSLADMEVCRDRVIDGNPGQRFQLIRKFEGHSSWIRGVSFSPDHQWVATSSEDQRVRIWDPHTAEWQCTLEGHDAYVRAVDFSPAGKYLASGGQDRQVRLWKYI